MACYMSTASDSARPTEEFRCRSPATGNVSASPFSGKDGLESLPSPGDLRRPDWSVEGAWPRSWKAPQTGRYRVWMDYSNAHGPINTGITAAVKWLHVDCAGVPSQDVPLVMPHSDGVQASTYAAFDAKAHAACRFTFGQRLQHELPRTLRPLHRRRGRCASAQRGRLPRIANRAACAVEPTTP